MKNLRRISQLLDESKKVLKEADSDEAKILKQMADILKKEPLAIMIANPSEQKKFDSLYAKLDEEGGQETVSSATMLADQMIGSVKIFERWKKIVIDKLLNK